MPYSYPDNYSPADISTQLTTLARHFPSLELGRIKEVSEKTQQGSCLPDSTLSLIPMWQAVADSYCSACNIVLDLLNKTFPFENRLRVNFNDANVTRDDRTSKYLEKLRASQQSNVLLLETQFGKKWAEKSPESVLPLLAAPEFFLGTFEVGIMLLSNPDRLLPNSKSTKSKRKTSFDFLSVDCCGDIYSKPLDKTHQHPYFILVDTFIEDIKKKGSETKMGQHLSSIRFMSIDANHS